MTQVTRIPDWWRETTDSNGIKCIERTYEWLGVYGIFKYYPEDKSLVLQIPKYHTTVVYPNQNEFLSSPNIDVTCKELIEKTYREVQTPLGKAAETYFKHASKF